MPTLDYDRLPDDDSPALRAILARSFNFRDDFWDRWFEVLGRGPFRVVRQDGRILGGAAIHDFGQWLGGRLVPMGGIAAVGVAPEARGAGVAASLMTGILRELRERAVPITTLWASTKRVYRKVGYEQAGSLCRFRLTPAAVGITDRDLPLREIDLSDFERMREMRRRYGETVHGCVERTDAVWRGLSAFRPPDQTRFAIEVGPEDRPEGYAILTQTPTGHGYEMAFRDFVPLTPAARRRLWTYVMDSRSLAESIVFEARPGSPDLYLFPEDDWDVTLYSRWLLRLTDVPGALAARGYADGAEAEVHLEVADDVLPENSGRYVLGVVAGRGEVEPGGTGAIRIDVRDLAPLYTGLFRASDLRALGRLEGADAAVAEADRAFAGPEPFMSERF